MINIPTEYLADGLPVLGFSPRSFSVGRWRCWQMQHKSAGRRCNCACSGRYLRLPPTSQYKTHAPARLIDALFQTRPGSSPAAHNHNTWVTSSFTKTRHGVLEMKKPVWQLNASQHASNTFTLYYYDGISTLIKSWSWSWDHGSCLGLDLVAMGLGLGLECLGLGLGLEALTLESKSG